MEEENYKKDTYYESWLKRNTPYIKLYGILSLIGMFIVFPWVIGVINILTYILTYIL